MKTKKQVVLRLMAIASLIVMMLAFAGPVGAVPVITELRCGQAVVDGNSSEWSVPANFDDWGTSPDFVAYMYRGFDSTKPVEAAVFVRYDLPTETAYLLVLAKPGVPGIKSDADAWVSISDSSGKITPKVVTGSSVDDGVPPDFAWVGVGYDGDPNHVRGYEASFSLAPTTSTYLGAHLQVYDDVLSQTSGLNGKTVEIKTGCLLGSIGDYVWHDIDLQGDQDEPASEGLAGIEVRLVLKSGNTYSPLKTEITDYNGYYLFEDLPATLPGQVYVVDCNQYDLPNPEWVLTTQYDPWEVTLDVGENIRYVDFGFGAIAAGTVALGDYVWYDKNSPYGVQNGDDESPENAGLQCITIFLYSGNHVDPASLIGQTNTDTYGGYTFKDLLPGWYTTAVDGTDPDLSQVDTWQGTATPRPCHNVAELKPALMAMQPDAYPTGAGSISHDVSPAGTVNLTFDFGFSVNPTALTLQAFGATPVPLASLEVVLAAAGALVAGALALKRRR